MKNLFYCLSFLMLFVTACKKDKVEPTEKNVAGVYKITGLKAKANGGTEVDVFNQLTECQKNDSWNFQDNGTLQFNGASTTSCQSQSFTGSWSLNNESFTIAAPQNTTVYQLEKFDGRDLVLSTAGTLNGDAARYYVTFTKN